MCRVIRVFPAGVNQLQLLSLVVMSTTWSLSRHVVAHGTWELIMMLIVDVTIIALMLYLPYVLLCYLIVATKVTFCSTQLN